MSKQDRQGARTVADLNRRYNVKQAMGAASSSLKASEEARNNAQAAASSAAAASAAVADKVDKKDYDTVVEMLNASNAIVKLLAGRLIIESDNFTLSEKGSVVAKDITLQNGADTDDYSVNISDGVIKVNSPTKTYSGETYKEIELMHFNIKDYGVYRLSILVSLQEEVRLWHFEGFAISPYIAAEVTSND